MADENPEPAPHETYRTMQSLAAGQLVLERYTLRKFLGRGGFGVVWLAHDEELELEVAIKFLSDLIVNNPEAVADLKRETRHSLRLTHPNIVRIHGFLQGPQIAAISMEYVDGGTMSALKTDRPQRCFNHSELAPIVTQLIDALDYAHTRAQIVHRDLKPGNLMLTTGGELKVADFGISRSISDTHTRLSEASPTSGTPAYMSPQQMMGKPPSVTDDIYSLGATIYDLLAGKPPFYTGDVPSQVLRVTPPPIAERRQELEIEGAEPVSHEWEKALAACLAKSPEGRPPGVRDVAELLGLAVPTRSLTDSRFPVSGATGEGIGAPSDSGSLASRGPTGTGPSQASTSAAPPPGGTAGVGNMTQTPAGPWAQEAAPPKRNMMPLALAGLSLVALAVALFLVVNRPRPQSGPVASTTTNVPAGAGSVVPGGAAAPGPKDVAAPQSAGVTPTPTASTPASESAATGAPPVDGNRARVVELSAAIPNNLSRRNWDEAGRQLQELIGLDPNLPQLTGWQAELNAGRSTERGVALRESVQRAIAQNRWDRAEADNEQLLALIPGDPQGLAWRSAIGAGRTAELERSAPPPAAPATSTPPSEATGPAADERAVRGVLDAYARSLEALDINRYAGLWQSLSNEEQRKLTLAFGQIRSQSIEVEIKSVEPSGRRAAVRGREHRRVEMKQGSPQSIDLEVNFMLEKSADGRWLIVRREYR